MSSEDRAAPSPFPWARCITLATLALLVLGLVWIADDPRLVKRLTRESGLVENLTALLWASCGVLCLACATRANTARLNWLLGGVILLALAARELDFQKRFTDWNLNNKGNYLDPEIPLVERLGVLLLFALPLAATGVAFLLRMWPQFREAWRQGLPWSRDIPLLLLMYLVAGRLDKIHHYGADLGIDMSYRFLYVGFEEVTELCVALLVALTLLPAWRRALRLGREGPQ